MERAELKIEREVNTYWDLNQASYVMLEITSEISGGQYYTIMSSLLFSAFTFEAYLNHLGAKKISFWNEIESIRTMNKYEVLTKYLGIEPDYGRRPYQMIRDLIKFRNALAHGKSKILRYSNVVDASVEIEELAPREHWEEFCTLENAKNVRNDLKEIVIELNTAAGEDYSPFLSGMTTGSMSLT